jgi:uncharacterized protein (TIGR00255 family)
MTGYGRGEATSGGMTVSVEMRSVNSRFLEVATRLPRSLANRESEIKELIRREVVRGKVNVSVNVDREDDGATGLQINTSAAKTYYRLLKDLRRTLKLRETVRLEHLLHFSEILEQQEGEDTDLLEWQLTQKAVVSALAELNGMRRQEGQELAVDFRARIQKLERTVDHIEQLSREQVPRERDRLRERIRQLMEDAPVDEGRLEMEIVLLADRLDVTEECVRFRSHNKFFVEAMDGGEAAGRKLNFLLQEMNREANTIGSKSSASEIAYLVVGIKEELEKVREQLQNIE